MRLVHREILWSLAATAGVTAALAGWAIDPPTNQLAAVLAWGGFALGLLGTACAHTLYGRRTAPLPVAIGLEQCNAHSGPIRCILLAGHPDGHNYGGLHPHSHRNITRLLTNREDT